MGKVISLARFTLLQGLKERFFVGLLVLLLFAFAAVEYLGLLSLSDPVKVVTDLGTSSITFLSLALILFFAITFLFKEKEDGMLHLILSRPVSRPRYLIGRFLGFLLLLLPFVAAGFLLLGATLLLLYHRAYPGMAWLAVAVSLELTVVLAFAVLASVFFSGQVTALLGTISFYVVCQLSHQAAIIARQGNTPVAVRITLLVERVLPSFALYQPFALAQAPAGYKAMLVLYTVIYSVAFLAMAAAILERKEL